MRRVALAGGLALALAGCGPETPARPARAAPPVPVPGRIAAPVAVASIQGQSANALIARFGSPQIDLQEGPARKLQFLGPICVLDAYLYPPASGRGEATVRHVDTRQRNGGPIDPISCAAALTRRPIP
jgi:hypothetical protein